MNLSEIIYEVGEISIGTVRLESDFVNFTNRAIRTICTRRNWNFMHNRTQVTIPSGQTSVSLGLNFKQLSPEKSPISFTYGLYNLQVYVASREETESWGIWPWVNGYDSFPTPGSVWPIRVVFMEQDGPGGAWTLNIPPQFPAVSNLPYNVSAFWYPDDLVLGTDSNGVTNDGQLCDALINLTRALCYTALDPTSKQAAASRVLYEDYFRKACYQNESQHFGGRPLRL